MDRAGRRATRNPAKSSTPSACARQFLRPLPRTIFGQRSASASPRAAGRGGAHPASSTSHLGARRVGAGAGCLNCWADLKARLDLPPTCSSATTLRLVEAVFGPHRRVLTTCGSVVELGRAEDILTPAAPPIHQAARRTARRWWAARWKSAGKAMIPDLPDPLNPPQRLTPFAPAAPTPTQLLRRRGFFRDWTGHGGRHDVACHPPALIGVRPDHSTISVASAAPRVQFLLDHERRCRSAASVRPWIHHAPGSDAHLDQIKPMVSPWLALDVLHREKDRHCRPGVSLNMLMQPDRTRLRDTRRRRRRPACRGRTRGQAGAGQDRRVKKLPRPPDGAADQDKRRVRHFAAGSC